MLKKIYSNYVNDYFVTFFRAVLKQVIIMGWACFKLKKSKDMITKQTIMIPEVVDVNYIHPEIVLDKSKLTYSMQCFDHTGNEKMKGVTFLFFKDIQALANTTLTHSLLSGLVDDFRYMQQVRQFALQAEYVRTNPTVYLEEQNCKDQLM